MGSAFSSETHNPGSTPTLCITIPFLLHWIWMTASGALERS